MLKNSFRMTLLELVAGILIVGLLAALLLPSLARSREAARRSSCPNNLKQLGVIFKMYANESPAQAFPPVSPLAGNWTMDVHVLYPEFLTDQNVLMCPSTPLPETPFELKNNLEHSGARIGDFSLDCVWSLSYLYTGYAILTDAQASALFDASRAAPMEVFTTDLLLEVPLWDSADLGRVAEDAQNPSRQAMLQSMIPIVWDRISADPALDKPTFNHVPGGTNVLYLDGHVTFNRFAYGNASSMFPVTQLAAETFGNDVPQLPGDCYSR